MEDIKEVIQSIEDNFKPLSIFLYGSRARSDFLKESDFEIGIIFKKENYVGRREIKKTINKKGFSIYPFDYESFIKGKLDTPFQKKIYLKEIISGGKTLSGEKIIESMEAPQISIVDLMQDLRFNLGYALASIISYRNGDEKTTSLEFYKSCLFATRALEILQLRVFPIAFDDILSLSRKLNLGEYQELVEKAFNVRKREQEYKEQDIFKNISYLNDFIEPLLRKFFEEKGNEILLK